MNTYEQRRTDFHQLYDLENDPAVTLVDLVRAAGDFLTEIVGPERGYGDEGGNWPTCP